MPGSETATEVVGESDWMPFEVESSKLLPEVDVIILLLPETIKSPLILTFPENDPVVPEKEELLTDPPENVDLVISTLSNISIRFV